MKKAVLCILASLSVLVSVKAQGVDQALVDAVSLYSNGQYAKAQGLLQTLSVASPSSDALWYYLAQCQIRSNNLEGALSSLEKAVALDSTNFWYRQGLARLYLAQGNKEEGKTMLEALVKDFPGKQSLPYELLEIYVGEKDFDKALGALGDIERQMGPSEAIASTRHDIYQAMGRPDLATEALEAFNKDFSSPQILTMLGDAYLADFADSLARARYSEALSLDGSYIPAILGMAEVHRRQRQYPEYFQRMGTFLSSPEISAQAKSLYIGNIVRSIDPKTVQARRQGFDSLATLAISTSPADTSLYSAVGGYYYNTGRPEEAQKYLKASMETFPDNMGATITYIQLLSVQEKWEQVRDASVEAFGRFHELGFFDYANIANHRLEDFDAIIANCRYIIKNYPREDKVLVSSYATLGDAYHSKGNVKDAYKAYEKALKIDPSYSLVLNNYAYFLSLEGRKLKKAYAMSRKTVEAEPDNSTYLDTFGWILHLMGRDLEAKPFFKHAMLYGGKESSVILLHYAEVLEALGEKDSAQFYINMAKRLEQ